MKKVRMGIIGCGAIHAIHADAAQKGDGLELAGFYDVVPGKAKQAGEKFGVPSYRSLKALFDACDAVSVCVPSGLHAKVGMAAAKAGKHVLCEKPIDVKPSAAMALVEACEANNVVLSVISQHRFANDIRRAKEALESGELGDLVFAEASIKWYRTQAYYDSGDWRGTWKLDGGGCLMNQGVHYVDMLQWVTGGIESVQAQIRTAAHDIEVEDVATALVTFKNGAIGTIRGSTCCFPGLAEGFELFGRYGSVVIEGDRIKLWEVDTNAPADKSPYGRGVAKQPTPSVHLNDKEEEEGSGAADPTAIWGEQHELQMEDFAQAIVDGRPPFITGREAIKPLQIILAIYESARKGGRRIMIP
jgi:UDP-N-acetyl-2-amino-2-deoxyglucuronate dehydrogenase